MSKAELHSRLIPLMHSKLPLSDIIKTISDIPEERVIAAFDDLMCEAFDIELAYAAA